MTTFRLEALKARYGDALMLHTADELILIDGGAARVYEQFLRPRLEELRGRRRTLPIRLMILSHIDDDHVNGLLKLTNDLIEAEDQEKAPLVSIAKLWHNSFSDVIAKPEEERGVRESALEVASVGGLDPDIGARLASPTRLVLQSVGQGRRLRRDADRLGIELNRGFEDRLVLRETAAGRAFTEGGCTFRVVGPGQAEVDDLKERWAKDVKKILEKERDREAALEAASRLDRSVFNLASIVLLAESDGRTMLLTGDARGDMILDWLGRAGLLDEEGKAHYDLIKLPHHGSDRNVTLDFFEKVTADHYVVSGDGRHGNPEPATLDMLFTARAGGPYQVHLTYGPEELREHDEFDAAAFEKVLDKHPGSRDRLRFPLAGQTSISVDLPLKEPSAPALETASRPRGADSGTGGGDGTGDGGPPTGDEQPAPERRPRPDFQESLVRKLLYEMVGGRRFTQDTPIMPEVWVAYAKNPSAPQDLILTPTRSTPAGQVAKELRYLLLDYRTQRQAWGPLAKTRKVRTRLAHLPGQLSARLYFDELMRIVLAVTTWWQDGPQKVREAPGPLCGFPDLLDKDAKQTPATLGDKKRKLREVYRALENSRRHVADDSTKRDALEKGWLTPDIIWLVRLSGAIALCATEPVPGFCKRLEEYLTPAAPDLSEEEREDREFRCRAMSRHLARRFLEIYHDWPVDRPDEDRLLFRVTLNRPAETAVHKSALTVKADAARLLFDISAENITWAVVDSGIDHTHPAFRKQPKKKAPQPESGSPPIPHGTGATDDPADSAPPREEDDERPSRVIHTFDFTNLRDLLDAEVIEEMLRQKEAAESPDSTGAGSGPALDPELEEQARDLLDALDRRRVADEKPDRGKKALLSDLKALWRRINKGHEIDWGLLERFIDDQHPDVPANEHGTHVAGILGANWVENDKTIMMGICPDVRLVDVRVLRDDGRSDEFEVMAAIQYLRYRNSRAGYMDVHGANLSLAIPHEVANYACGRTPICDECDEAVAIGMVIVAAAGNNGFLQYETRDGVRGGYSTVSITDPGNAEAVITVGSTHRNRPHEYGVSYFSSRGPTGDGRIKPDLVAPGEKVEGPVPHVGSAFKDGTSMAAPHVSGAAVLLMARHRELIAQPGRIKQILCDTATDLGRERYFQGAGLLDILRALQSI